tara:strand:- start:178 stop:327 length:150 start_codon:yes stop_codon:yes gene_type:complete
MFHTKKNIPFVGHIFLKNKNNVVLYSIMANENTELIEIYLKFIEKLKSD